MDAIQVLAVHGIGVGKYRKGSYINLTDIDVTVDISQFATNETWIIALAVDYESSVYALSTSALTKYTKDGTRAWSVAVSGIPTYPEILKVDNQNNVYFPSGKNIRKCDKNGNLTTITLNPAPTNNLLRIHVSPDGSTLYATDATTYNLYKLDANGNVIWSISTTDHQWVTADKDGTLYTSDGTSIRKVTSDGSVVWTKDAATILGSTCNGVVAHPNGTDVFATSVGSSGYFAALDPATGNVLRKHRAHESFNHSEEISALYIDKVGCCYVICYGTRLVRKYYKNANVAWEVRRLSDSEVTASSKALAIDPKTGDVYTHYYVGTKIQKITQTGRIV